MYKRLGILLIIFTAILFLLIIACPGENNPPSTTTTTTIMPQEYQGVYLKKYNMTPPQPDKMTITPTKLIYEIWDGSEYALFFDAKISSFQNNILIMNLTKLNIYGSIKNIPGLIYEDSFVKKYLTSYIRKYKCVEKIINSKKCFYIENIYIGGNTSDLTGTWKYQEYEQKIALKFEQNMGGNTVTYYGYAYTKMPEITFNSSNKMLFKGYKYGPEENNPLSKWKWYTFDVTADCTINMTNKTIQLENIEATNAHLPSWITLQQGDDYPAETTFDSYKFEIVDNYLVFPWKQDNKEIYYFEKQ